jgi:hypothetical protein
LTNPWTADLALSGSLHRTNTETMADGHLTYDGQTSSFRIRTEARKDTSNFEVSLDIPILHQKLDTSISVLSRDSHRSQGKVEMMLNGRHLGLTCQLFSKLIGTHSPQIQKESRLGLTLILPFEDVPQINSELIIRKPLSHFGNMEVSARVTVRDEVSDLFFRYTLPVYGQSLLSVSAACNTPLLSSRRHSLSLSSQGPSFSNFDGQATYGLNEAKIHWSVLLPDVSASFRILTDSHSYGMNEYSANIKGLIDLKSMFNLTVEAVFKEKTLTFSTSTRHGGGRLTSEMNIFAPQLLGAPHKYNLELKEVHPRTMYTVTTTGNQGSDNVNFSGELSIGQNVTAQGKLTGSYGTHYGILTLQRILRKLVADLQLESTTLLVGKRVSIVGQLGWESLGFSGDLQCQTSTAIHKSSIKGTWKPDSGILEFKVDSPQMNPMYFSAEWTANDGNYYGVLKCNFETMVSSIEGLLNTRHLEGRLTIDSPFLPSSYFNAHLKAKNIVTLRNVDLLSDIQIRNIHWRLEGVMKYAGLKDMTLKLHILTPYKSFSKLILAAKSTEDEIYAELHTPFVAIPNLMIEIGGIQAVQQQIWTNMKPRITVGLPFGTYCAFGKVSVNAPTLQFYQPLYSYFSNNIFFNRNCQSTQHNRGRNSPFRFQRWSI